MNRDRAVRPAASGLVLLLAAAACGSDVAAPADRLVIRQLDAFLFDATYDDGLTITGRRAATDLRGRRALSAPHGLMEWRPSNFLQGRRRVW
jgi:hypothetical protein